MKKRLSRWELRGSKSLESLEPYEEKILDCPLTETPFKFKEGEEEWLAKINIAPIDVKFEIGDTLKLHRILAAREGSRRRQEVLGSELPPEEKRNQIILLYKRASEDNGFHPKTMRVGPKNMQWLAELALAHGRTLDYVLDRVVEAARYGIPPIIKADVCSRSESAIAGLKYRQKLEGLAADLIREEIERERSYEDQILRDPGETG